ncbi:MAG: tryptophan--tRNA ligase, partial [Cyanobacteria bacterium REEB65]|nr:tryptophan--tRNA ligase [Cyanobacteria bacterium REEB65]
LIMLGQAVPVGKDQLPHLELSRDIARRFNNLYGEVFPEPAGLLTETPLVVGLDGRKMSKSYGNDIRLSSTPEEIEVKVMTAITDPARQRRHDPGHPEVCTIYAYWQLLHAESTEQVARDCRLGTLGCVDDKRHLAAYLNDRIAPMRERRERLARDPERLDAILADGNARARKVARQTMEIVREAMQLNTPTLALAQEA